MQNHERKIMEVDATAINHTVCSLQQNIQIFKSIHFIGMDILHEHYI